jgi:predicted metalloprotease with PDZ domain
MVVAEASARVQLATEVAYARAMEALAADLAVYFASGIHVPIENARQAVVRMLERTLELPLNDYLEEFKLTAVETDEAHARALDCIGNSIGLIRAAALPKS